VPAPITLLPLDINRPNRSGDATNVPVPASALPEFGTPKHVVSDGFISNLKQFFTERPVKVSGQVNSTLMPPSYGGGFTENLKEFFSSRPVPKGPVNSRLAVSWGTNFGGFGYRLKEFFSPTKLPPLQVTSKPIKVKDIWSKDENFGWTQIISVALHIGIMALLILPFIWKLTPTSTANTIKPDVTQLELSDYVSKLPAGSKTAGGGTGGGGFRAGVNGVGKPECIYCPNPDYSEEARKAKYGGFVLLDVLVSADGRVSAPIVIKGPGLGLEEKAMEAVVKWKMRPANGPGGKPVACRVQIEVDFRLY
jgi:TonB family protein